MIKSCAGSFDKKKYSTVLTLSLLVLISSILITLAGFRPVGLDRDSANYAAVIKKGYSDESIKEPAFIIVKYVNECLLDGTVTGVFLIFAVLGVATKVVAFKRLSHNPIFSTVLYVFFYYILHDMTQIRIGVASGFFLLSISDRLRGKDVGSITKMAVATAFHFSAIVGFIIFLFNKDSLNRPFYFLLPIFGILFSVFLSNFPFEEYMTFLPSAFSVRLEMYMALKKSGVYSTINVFNVYYIFMFAVYYLSLLTVRMIEPNNYLYIKLIGTGLFSFYAFSFLPVLSFRLSEFFSIVIIIFLSNLTRVFHSAENKMAYMALVTCLGSAYFFQQGLVVNLDIFGR